MADKIRILVTLRNNSPKKSIEGIVLKYAVSMHITPNTHLHSKGPPTNAGGQAGGEIVKPGSEFNPGMWSVPFSVEESRISKIKPLKTHQVRIIQINLNEHLKKLINTGFWVDMLKIQVMLEPRSGDTIENIIRESTITVVNN